jgi:hypothetical protein
VDCLIFHEVGLQKEITFTGFRHGGIKKVGYVTVNVRPTLGHATLDVARIYNKVTEERGERSRQRNGPMCSLSQKHTTAAIRPGTRVVSKGTFGMLSQNTSRLADKTGLFAKGCMVDALGLEPRTR